MYNFLLKLSITADFSRYIKINNKKAIYEHSSFKLSFNDF